MFEFATLHFCFWATSLCIRNSKPLRNYSDAVDAILYLEATSKPLRNHFETTSKLLRNHFEITSKSLRNYFCRRLDAIRSTSSPAKNADTFSQSLSAKNRETKREFVKRRKVYALLDAAYLFFPFFYTTLSPMLIH